MLYLGEIVFHEKHLVLLYSSVVIYSNPSIISQIEMVPSIGTELYFNYNIVL